MKSIRSEKSAMPGDGGSPIMAYHNSWPFAQGVCQPDHIANQMEE